MFIHLKMELEQDVYHLLLWSIHLFALSVKGKILQNNKTLKWKDYNFKK